MNADKAELLFGALPEGADPDDPDQRAALFADELNEGEDQRAVVRAALREVIANQITDEDPAEVWSTARRLRTAGLDRDRVLSQLSLALTSAMKRSLEAEAPFDRDAYVADLERLPLPSGAELEAAIVGAARELQPIAAEELEQRVAERLGLGLDLDDEMESGLLDHTMDWLVDPDGPLEYVAGDLVVHVASLTEGIVLTHRVSEAELAAGALHVDFDLAGFVRLDDLRMPDGGAVETFSMGHGHLAWRGPEGWLAGLAAGDVAAVSVSADGVVLLERLDGVPAVDDNLVAVVRGVYHAEVEEPWMPVSGEDLVLAMLARDRSVLAEAHPPLDELCAAAGLERRGHQVAHEASTSSPPPGSSSTAVCMRSWRPAPATASSSGTCAPGTGSRSASAPSPRRPRWAPSCAPGSWPTGPPISSSAASSRWLRARRPPCWTCSTGETPRSCSTTWPGCTGHP